MLNLWFNLRIRINISTIYLKSHFNPGYKFLKNLMADEVNFVSLEPSMFLENMGLKEAISKRLKASKYNKVEY